MYFDVIISFFFSFYVPLKNVRKQKNDNEIRKPKIRKGVRLRDEESTKGIWPASKEEGGVPFLAGERPTASSG